jgi:UDP-GlcNAc3NAcA epimerase
MTAKIISIVGARPQFVKAAVVSEQLSSYGLQEVMIHTGQHYDLNMSRSFFTTLNLPEPKYNLGIGGGSHAEMTGRQLIAIEERLREERPDAVLVYGDTNSTLAGALAAVKLWIPVAHVEAGLRSFNNRMPEEINRIVTDRISAVMFSPSKVASDNLRAEGVAVERIVEVGDVMYDAALRYGGNAVKVNDGIKRCVVTIHRAENTDDDGRLRTIVNALERLAREFQITFPVHPRTRQALARIEQDAALNAVVNLVEPIGYIEMLAAVRAADVVITDSGGLQKEAYFLGTPCVTLRGETEWTETVALGWNCLVTELSVDNIIAAAHRAQPPAQAATQPYGDGTASARIARYLRDML